MLEQYVLESLTNIYYNSILYTILSINCDYTTTYKYAILILNNIYYKFLNVNKK